MGLFDYVSVNDPRFVCSEGHDMRGEQFQTKDLGCTMGDASIGASLIVRDGGWGDTLPQPFTGEIEIYTDCPMCPAFVQAETFNVHPVGVEFTVVVECDAVVRITRTSPTSAEQIAEAPTLRYMPNCRGPMSHEDACKRKMDHKFMPWDPIPVVSDEVRAAQQAWSDELDAMRAKYTKAVKP